LFEIINHNYYVIILIKHIIMQLKTNLIIDR